MINSIPPGIINAARTILENNTSDEKYVSDMSDKIEKISKEFKLDQLYIDVGETLKDLGRASARGYIESLLVDKVSEYRHESFYRRLCDAINKAFGSRIL